MDTIGHQMEATFKEHLNLDIATIVKDLKKHNDFKGFASGYTEWATELTKDLASKIKSLGKVTKGEPGTGTTV